MDANVQRLLLQVAAGGLVLLLPGYVWVTWFPSPGKGAAQRLAEALGLSVALNTLLALIAFYLRLRLAPTLLAALYGVLGLMAAISLGLYFRHMIFQARVIVRRLKARFGPRRAPEVPSHPAHQEDEESPPRSARQGPTLLLLLAFLALIAWRLYQSRTLALPAWVDSLHHVLIVRLFGEYGGVPQSFAPYMPVPFYYHFAFHQSAALFSFWARLEPARAVLLLGQVLNAAVALAVYRLAMAVWQDWRRAGLAGLLVGFVSQMPAYYVTWGRYTLLTGLILLPLAMAAAVEVVRLGNSRERVARLAVLTAGLLLAHYFAAMLQALFILAILVLAPFSRRPAGSRPWGWALLGGSAAGLLIAAPWLARVWRFASNYTTLSTVSFSDPLDTIFFSDYLPYLWYLLGPQRNYLLAALGGLGWLLFGWRARARPLALWSLGLALVAVPWGLNLPPFRPDHAMIVLFLPLSLFAADGLLSTAERFQEGRLAQAGTFLVSVVLLGLLVWGIKDTRQILNPVTVLADQADLQAIEWVKANTPSDARFFINVTLWQTGTYRGVDGGWWIMPLTGRRTLVPPAMYILGERDFVLQTNEWAARAGQVQACSPAMWELLRDAEIDYIYLRAGRGNLKAQELMSCEGLALVYERGGVTIFHIP